MLLCQLQRAVSESPPAWFPLPEHDPLLELGAKASAAIGFYSRSINSLPAATYSTVSSLWETILVRFRKVICLLCAEAKLFLSVLIYLQE